MPSYSELTAVVGFRSKHAVYQLVQRLVAHEWLEKDAAGTLLPGRLFSALPLLGTVTAGFPSPAEEELADTMTLDECLITNKEATYILKVHGESMIEAGLLPGDMLLVERGAEPRDGDIVIAQVDREWTMKYFRKRGREVFLEAAAYRQDKAPLHAHTPAAASQHPIHVSPCHREPTPSRARTPAAGSSRPAPQGTDRKGAG